MLQDLLKVNLIKNFLNSYDKEDWTKIVTLLLEYSISSIQIDQVKMNLFKEIEIEYLSKLTSKKVEELYSLYITNLRNEREKIENVKHYIEEDTIKKEDKENSSSYIDKYISKELLNKPIKVKNKYDYDNENSENNAYTVSLNQNNNKSHNIPDSNNSNNYITAKCLLKTLKQDIDSKYQELDYDKLKNKNDDSNSSYIKLHREKSNKFYLNKNRYDSSSSRSRSKSNSSKGRSELNNDKNNDLIKMKPNLKNTLSYSINSKSGRIFKGKMTNNADNKNNNNNNNTNKYDFLNKRINKGENKDYNNVLSDNEYEYNNYVVEYKDNVKNELNNKEKKQIFNINLKNINKNLNSNYESGFNTNREKETFKDKKIKEFLNKNSNNINHKVLINDSSINQSILENDKYSEILNVDITDRNKKIIFNNNLKDKKYSHLASYNTSGVLSRFDYELLESKKEEFNIGKKKCIEKEKTELNKILNNKIKLIRAEAEELEEDSNITNEKEISVYKKNLNWKNNNNYKSDRNISNNYNNNSFAKREINKKINIDKYDDIKEHNDFNYNYTKKDIEYEEYDEKEKLINENNSNSNKVQSTSSPSFNNKKDKNKNVNYKFSFAPSQIQTKYTKNVLETIHSKSKKIKNVANSIINKEEQEEKESFHNENNNSINSKNTSFYSEKDEKNIKKKPTSLLSSYEPGNNTMSKINYLIVYYKKERLKSESSSH